MSKTCKHCGIEKPLTEFHRDGNGYVSRCKPCACAKSREWNKLNKERKSKLGRQWAEQNAERKKEMDRIWRENNSERKRQQNREYARINSKKKVANVAKWRRENKEKSNAYRRAEMATRRARIKKAMPPWASMEDIHEVYREAARVSAETGVPHDVDHIIPIAGRRACGLHIAANLRVIPASENRKKSNKETECAGVQWFPEFEGIK